jgi:hypothetical protein
MPIEIKELHIKATVVEKKSHQGVPTDDLKREQEKMKKEIMKECVQEILQILEDKRER